MVRGDVATILEPASLSALEKLGDWLILYFIVKNVDLLTVNQVQIAIPTNDSSPHDS